MRVLVTGAAGFLGQHLCPALEAAGHAVTGVDRRDADLVNPGQLAYTVSRAAPDVVVHLAAQVGRLFGEQDYAHTIATNAQVTTGIAIACRDADARLVYLSTSEVYGDAEGHGLTASDDDLETLPDEHGLRSGDSAGYPLPYNLYGLTKRWGEEAARLYCPTGLRIVRLSMPYGPGLPPGKGRAAIVNMLAQAHRREPITVHAGAKRCWCWVGDSVDGILRIVQDAAFAKPADSEPCAFNVGRDDNETSMLTVAEMACEIAGVGPGGGDEGLIEEVEAPANQVLVKRLPTANLRALGWEPRVELREGMQRTYDAMLKAGQL